MFISKILWKSNNLSNPYVYDQYQVHQMVWNIFSESPSQKRNFIFRQDFQHGLPLIYVVSKSLPNNDISWNIDTKPYSPKLKEGQKLAFMVRVNPIVNRKSDKPRSSKHDIIMDAKIMLKLSQKPITEWPTKPELIQSVGTDWLKKQGEKHGFIFSPESASIDSYQQLKLYSKKSMMKLSTLDISGLLIVTDVEKFIQMLYQGLGSAKSFGCGLMLIRKV